MKKSVKSGSLPCTILADRWGDRWTEQATTLLFGNNEEHAAIRLEPASIKALSLALKQTLHQEEARNGTIWGECREQIARQNDASLFGEILASESAASCRFPTNNFLAHRLYFLIRNLQLNGCERSFKLLSGTVLPERFLAGIATTKIASEDAAFIALQMGMPPAFFDAFVNEFDTASFLHIGFEQSVQAATYKLYLEFPEASGKPLYIGYKWNPGNAQDCAISRYTRPESMPLTQLLDRITHAYLGTDQAAANIAQRIVRLAAERLGGLMETDTLLFVDVNEEDTPRHSFDINLYESDLRVRELAPMLDDLRQHFAIDEKEWEELMMRTRDDLAGHLSGGSDRHGNAFLTLYHARMTVG